MTISREAWLKAYTDVQVVPVNDPDLLSIAEIADLFGITHKGAQIRVKRMLEAGKLQQAKKWVRTAAGSVRSIPAYRLTP